MKIRKKEQEKYEADMTPMIDMTFQLIAFFMILINFSDNEQHRKVKLPRSEVVKPPEEPLELPLVIHVGKDGKAICKGDEVDVDDIGTVLRKYKESMGQNVTRDAVIVIRGDEKAQAGAVQDLIKGCQDEGFNKFALRAEQQKPRRRSG